MLVGDNDLVLPGESGSQFDGTTSTGAWYML